ncbi:twin-arginine translocase TatA/TatE family subunit [Flavobacterium sp.]|uniref:Sec-independent protein translocase subunit TatA/TatB n=1 Tax=Flavobacterium sp. TaxID=239 RepID=UPI002488DBB8|nr:twin-arginine translocase TatA/TatE family subunit [Flavobacterium sp.]MDI1317562.1 twin-arginine translocase TatA/TatE family subunit [Flavobacterium sp.]
MKLLTIFLGEFGVNQMILVAVVVLLFFGGKKIPELMKGLGSGVNEFKKASKGEEEANAVSKKEEEEAKK